MASVYSSRKRKKADRATDVHITKYFRTASPTTKVPTFESGSVSGTSSSNDPDGHYVTDTGHVSDHDSESSDSEPEEPEDAQGRGDGNIGPALIEQHPTVRLDSNSVNDLGVILNRESMTVMEVSRAISGLTPGQRYTLLTDHYKPD